MGDSSTLEDYEWAAEEVSELERSDSEEETGTSSAVDSSDSDEQSEEVEALSAIYGEEWCIVDEDHKIYCIQVTDGQTQKTHLSVQLQVHMPDGYPLEGPPEYQLNAPWLRGEEKRQLEGALAEIYCDNVGESIIYLWVEKIREFLQGKADVDHQDVKKSVLFKKHVSNSGDPDQQQRQRRSCCITPGSRQVVMTTETENEDDFDLSELDLVSSDHSDDVSESDHDWECPAVSHGDIVTDRRSTFQPHLAPVFHKSQVKMVMNRLYENKKISNATHNIMAYRIVQEASASVVYQGCDDDGETHAGSRMLHLMQILDVKNVIVVVSRWYGGIHLGPDRFKHINNCTRTILQQHGYIKDKIVTLPPYDL